MGQSSLLGGDWAIPVPKSRHNSALGPSDSSDSASGMAGVDETNAGDPALPVDVALGDDSPYGQRGRESRAGTISDAAGTTDSADIGVDRVFAPDGDDATADQEWSDDEDPDLAFIDGIQAADLVSEEHRSDEEEGAERQGNP